MDEDTATILVITAVPFLFFPYIVLFAVGVLDITGVDRMLPGPLFPITASLLSTVIICGILAPVMKFLRKPAPWIKMALTRIGLVAYFLSLLIVNFFFRAR
ncbi:hypothetical protein [Thermococcus celer]|uniref:Uncharacterized protein n=1 Tax=Thermococcus celer Vu 13 = JCM 8558 TaxID=1293037 RepID=A0A218P442_THECE|nr:hypothetical protein [Thermococcus celer]ASI99714.1 hypothetical protein A3L02_09145 [Thermococcus celer Vu 13 = JCM 8558]